MCVVLIFCVSEMLFVFGIMMLVMRMFYFLLSVCVFVVDVVVIMSYFCLCRI